MVERYHREPNKEGKHYYDDSAPFKSAEKPRSSSYNRSYPETVNLSPTQAEYYNTLSESDKDAFLKSVATRRAQPTQTQISPEQAEQVKNLQTEQERVEYISNISSRRLQTKQSNLTKQQEIEVKKLLLNQQGEAIRTIERKALSKDIAQQYESVLGRPLNPVERTVIRTGEFLRPEEQKARIKQAGQTYELAGRQLGNIFVKGQPFTEKPISETRQDKVTKILTSPAFLFGAPLAVASGVALGAQATTLVEGSKVGTFGLNLLGTTARGVVVAEGTKEIGRLTTERDYQDFVNSKEYKTAIKKAYEEEGSNISKEAFYKGLAYDVSPLFGKKDVFIESLKKSGFSDEQIDVALRDRLFRTTGEALGLLEISRSAEASGRKAVKRLGKEVGKIGGKGIIKTGLALAPSIGQAGFQEGFAGALIQQRSRAQEADLQKALGAGSVGAVSASLLGGVIGGLGVGAPVTSKKAPSSRKLGKVVEFTANIIDPFEKPGDLAQDFAENILRPRSGIGKGGLKVEKIISVREAKVLLPDVKFGGVKPITLISARTKTQTAITTTTKEKGKVKSLVTLPNVSQRPITLSPAQTPVNIQNIQTSIGVQTPSESPVPIITEVPSQVPTDTLTNTNIPTFTPLFRLPPALPIGSGGSLGFGFGTSKRRGKTFIDEISQTLGALGGFTPKQRKKKK